MFMSLYYLELLLLANSEEVLVVQDDDSDMEFELEASPAVSVDAVSEAVAHVKVSLRTLIFLLLSSLYFCIITAVFPCVHSSVLYIIFYIHIGD